MRLASSPRIFRTFASLYGWYTNQDTWRASISEMVRHLPPSAGGPRILDLGCGPGVSALTMARQVPEARIIGLDLVHSMLHEAQRYTAQVSPARPPVWLQADAARLPLAASSVDAITGHSFLYLVQDRAAILAEARRVLRPGGRLILVEPAVGGHLLSAFRRLHAGFRFMLSVTLWHVYARLHGPFTPASLAYTLRQAGFVRVLAQPALAGLAVLGRGEAPFPEESPQERITGVVRGRRIASPRSRLVDRHVDPRADDLTGLGRSIYLLITQRPNQPGWQPAEDEEVSWDALTVTDRTTGEEVLLGFSSLVKAVEFMQPAVLSGIVRDVNKVGKFSWETARTWGRPIWLNPSLGGLRAESSRYLLPGRPFEVDYRQREKQEEG